VQYPSLDDWSLNKDLVRSSPCFYGQPRYDCIAWQVTDTKIAFGRLLSTFTTVYEGRTAHLALVAPYNGRGDAGARVKDRDFNFIRVRRARWSESCVIPLTSIVRGACLPHAWDTTSKESAEFLLNDRIDTDWWLRSRNLLATDGLDLG
jgi:hypothetical protein